MKRASQFKKSQTAVSTIERHFTLFVLYLIVERTKDSIRVTKKTIQIVVGWLGWKWIERSVLYNYYFFLNTSNYTYFTGGVFYSSQR